MKQRGMSIGVVSVIVALVVTAAFSLAGVSVTHLNLTVRGNAVHQAQNLARSAVAQGLERILSDSAHEYGVDRASGQLIDFNLAGAPDGQALLTFNEDEADSLGIPFSTNNVMQTASVTADSRVVPPASVHLVGVGKFGGVTRTAEAIYHVPPFPYAIASSGPIRASGGLIVSALEEAPTGPIATPDKLEPADVHSNSAESSAILLGAGSEIGGDVKAVGSVDYDRAPGAVNIQGQLLNNAPPEALLDMDLAEYDPAALGRTHESFDSSPYGDRLTVVGLARSNGSLEVRSGGLHLDGGVLFVDGDLKVSGGITGKGILAVRGEIDVNVRSVADFESSLAIFSSGDINISGSGPHGSYLQGLVHTEGNFHADEVTLVGVLIAGGAVDKIVDLENVRLFATPGETVSVDLGGGTENRYDGSGVTHVRSGGVSHTVEIAVSGTSSNLQVTFSGTVNRSMTTTEANFLADMVQIEPLVLDDLVAAGLSRRDIGSFPVRISAITSRMHAEMQIIFSSDDGSSGESGTLTADPSRFLRLEDRLRTVLWLER